MSNVCLRQADLWRALRAAKVAGIDVGRFEIDPSGKIIIIAKDTEEASLSPFDEWQAKRHARTTQGH